jgi:PIN domain nuclease of toxin-antitoxin system
VKYLLDTHTFLWAASDPSRLSARATELCETGDLLLSVASVWEIAIKVQIGKLRIPGPVREFICRQLRAGQIAALPIHARHTFRLAELPLHHRDPFDRMLAAQSLEEDLPLISCDPLFAPYQVERVW